LNTFFVPENVIDPDDENIPIIKKTAAYQEKQIGKQMNILSFILQGCAG
jgi:hypothetical protein